MPPKTRETRFPTGRIKKIMQQDEEVGKVAKAAPVLVSKALELLIGELVSKASAVTKSQKAVTINVKHLREAVAKEKTFDFLQDSGAVGGWLRYMSEQVVGKFVPSNESDNQVIGSDVEDDAAAAGEDTEETAAAGAKEEKELDKKGEEGAGDGVVYAHRQIDEDYDDDDEEE